MQLNLMLKLGITLRLQFSPFPSDMLNILHNPASLLKRPRYLGTIFRNHGHKSCSYALSNHFYYLLLVKFLFICLFQPNIIICIWLYLISVSNFQIWSNISTISNFVDCDSAINRIKFWQCTQCLYPNYCYVAQDRATSILSSI